MSKTNMSAEKRLLGLFKRLRKLELDHCPDMNGIISSAQMILLEQIAVTPGCGVQDIAESLNLSTPTVSVGVSKIEARGLVERNPDPSDGRSVQFFLTQRGHTVYDRFQKTRQRKLQRLLGGLDLRDQEKFLRLFERALNSAEDKN